MPATTTEIVCDCRELPAFCEIWNDLRSLSSPSAASYDEYSDVFKREANDAGMYLVVVRENGQIVTLAPFLLLHKRKSYSIGPRSLFSLPVRQLRLMGNDLVGRANSEQLRHVLNALAERRDFDLIPFNELEAEGRFYDAIRGALTGSPWKCVRSVHKSTLHWSINLPKAFDEYLASLSPKSRKNRLRELRNFEKEYGGQVRVVTDEEDVDWFLEAGESISRLTYQWNVGQQLRSDSATRNEYRLNARRRQLRCYVLLAGDHPCAFARGTIRNGVYRYDTPGYDPQYSKGSPGTVLLMKVIEDLIANTECEVLDFGIGGGDTGYKKVFGNHCYEAISIELGRRAAPYTMVLFAIQGALNSVKRCAEYILDASHLKDSMKRALRKYGEH